MLAVTARALPIADPKTGDIAPINTDSVIQPEKPITHIGGKTSIIAEKIPSTYADAIDKEVGKDVEVEPKPYKTPEVDSVKTVGGEVVPDVEPVVAPVADSSLRQAAPTAEKVEAEKAPTLSVGDIGTKDPVESPNLHKVEGAVLDTEGHGVPHKVQGAEATSTVVEEGVDDETTRDEKVPDGVEQYGSVLEFSKYDTNSDGVIDIDEWSIIHGGHEKINGQFHAADINGDKQLEQTEFQGASWYHDGDQGADIARDALMLAIAEQAATAEHNHAMAAAVMPSTELRYIVDDAETSAQSVPVVPAEPVDVVVVPEKPLAPSVNADAAAVETVDFSTTTAPPKDGVNTVEPVVHKQEKTEVPQVPEVLKDVQRTDTAENTGSTTSKPVVAVKEHGEVTPPP
ncbi:uncharacterized protein LOC119395537 [Rhipicephalus sanguineus]|nr:uncharacterized protein LOC119395537 [Rhipicephalus sanguineus]